jgi:hypothetical protein
MLYHCWSGRQRFKCSGNVIDGFWSDDVMISGTILLDNEKSDAGTNKTSDDAMISGKIPLENEKSDDVMISGTILLDNEKSSDVMISGKIRLKTGKSESASIGSESPSVSL